MSAPWRFGGLAPSRICAELWQRALLAPRFSFRGLCGPDTCLGGLSASPARRGRRFQKLFSERWTGAARFAFGKILCFKRAAAGGHAICRFSVCIGRRSANLRRTGRMLRIARQSITVPRRAARDGCARVRPQDGASQCRLYIIMYSWAAESKAPWKTIPRHTCRAPFCRS